MKVVNTRLLSTISCTSLLTSTANGYDFNWGQWSFNDFDSSYDNVETTSELEEQEDFNWGQWSFDDFDSSYDNVATTSELDEQEEFSHSSSSDISSSSSDSSSDSISSSSMSISKAEEIVQHEAALEADLEALEKERQQKILDFLELELKTYEDVHEFCSHLEDGHSEKMQECVGEVTQQGSAVWEYKEQVSQETASEKEVILGEMDVVAQEAEVELAKVERQIEEAEQQVKLDLLAQELRVSTLAGVAPVFKTEASDLSLALKGIREARAGSGVHYREDCVEFVNVFELFDAPEALMEAYSKLLAIAVELAYGIILGFSMDIESITLEDQYLMHEGRRLTPEEGRKLNAEAKEGRKLDSTRKLRMKGSTAYSCSCSDGSDDPLSDVFRQRDLMQLPATKQSLRRSSPRSGIRNDEERNLLSFFRNFGQVLGPANEEDEMETATQMWDPEEVENFKVLPFAETVIGLIKLIIANVFLSMTGAAVIRCEDYDAAV